MKAKMNSSYFFHSVFRRLDPLIEAAGYHLM